MVSTPSRMDAPLTGTGTAPVVEQIAPDPDAFVVDDALSELLERGTSNPQLSPKQRAQLLALSSYRQAKAEFTRRAEALGKLIGPTQTELLNLIGELELDFDRPFAPENDGKGTEVRPYLKRPIWPAYRKNDETGRKFTAADLLDALYDGPAEHVIETKINHNAWSKWVKGRVTAWQRKCGGPAGDGAKNEQGEFVDHDGVVLTDAERGDVTWDGLALPVTLRRLVEPVEAVEIQFTYAPLVSAAADALDAAEADALAAQG